jgi:hypothetical protein
MPPGTSDLQKGPQMNLLKPDMGKVVYLVLGIVAAKFLLPRIPGMS